MSETNLEPISSSQIEFHISESNESGVLKLKGEIDVQHASEIKKILVEALEVMHYIKLDFKEVTFIGLSIIQLFFSAYKSALMLNKDITIEENCPVFREAVKITGFDRFKWLCFR